MCTLIVCDDHRLVREALAALLRRLPGVTRVVPVASADGLLPAYRALEPDCVLMDASLLDARGTTGALRLLEQEPGVRLVLLNADDGGLEALRALDSGAKGCLPSEISPAGAAAALARVLDGGDLLPGSRRRALSGYLRALPGAPRQLGVA